VTVRVKICGVTRTDDAAAIAATGVDYIGLNLWPRSKRYITPSHAAHLAATIRAASTHPVQVVGVFVDALPSEVAAVAAQVDLDVVQLHGDEHLGTMASAVRRPIWRAVAARPDLVLDPAGAEAILLDTPSIDRGGTGTTFDWTIAAAARRDHPTLRLVLAGGLSPDNVRAAIAAVEPWGVDVASGVESAPGVKDLAKVAAFLRAVRAVS